MGNLCSSVWKNHNTNSEINNSTLTKKINDKNADEKLIKKFHKTELKSLPTNERRAQLEEWLVDIQKHNLERLRKEMVTDLHGFILNNLLLCIQFYENFDSSMIEAEVFKQKSDAEMAEKLSSLVNDGVILGERKCTLMHGMGQEVAKNYIYKDDGHAQKKQVKQSEVQRRHVTTRTNHTNSTMSSDEPRSTFSCDSILPLEFTITWDNLEVYKESEWNSLREYQYSSAKGSPSISRVCVEETDDKNHIPKGFVRLRVVDTPLSIRSIHPIPRDQTSPSSSAGYVETSYQYSLLEGTEFSEKIQEVQTDSDFTESNSSSETDDDDRSGISINEFHIGIDLQQNLNPHVQSTVSISGPSNPKDLSFSINIDPFEVNDPTPTPQLFMTTMFTGHEHSSERKKSGDKSESYQKVISEFSNRKQLPRVTISADSPLESEDEESIPDEFPFSQSVKDKVKRFEENFTNLNQRKTGQSVPPPPPFNPSMSLPIGLNVVPSPSSGYESVTSPHIKVIRSRSSSASIASEDVHKKWRQVELKGLWQFSPKRRQNAREPLSEACYQKIQIEIESDEDERLDLVSDDESDDDTTSDSSSSTINEKRRAPSEPIYEDRTYLNSIGFSSDFCSEFKQIGTHLEIPDSTLRSGVVLGTTVRCSVPNPPGLCHDTYLNSSNGLYSLSSKTEKNNKNQQPITILHTFTPSLQSKNWPQKPLIWWKAKMLREAWDGTEKWPTRDQVEEIEQAGCNIIPLGSRSINSTQSQNIQQTLVWTVGFATAENILLNSFLHVQWRCLIFSSIVFRAFIAPLGPLGIGLEHFRNILYFMCHEEFLSWNYEQPAHHLKALLGKVYDCLGRGNMPSFFVTGHNLLKNIPVENRRKVQAYLSKVRNNLLFHIIFMLRNLVQVSNNFYPLPKDNFKRLYDYLTISEKQILYLVNPLLAGMTTEDLKKEEKKKLKKQQKKELQRELLLHGDLIDTAIGKNLPKFRQVDPEQRKLRRKRERWTEKQRIIKEQEAETARIKAEALKLPQDKKNSIDLEEMPLKQRRFTAQRLGLILKYFIKHFIKMAAKSYQFKSFAQASMYTQHVENLISILSELPNEANAEDTVRFQEDAKVLRETIGVHMIDYIREKSSYTETQPSRQSTTVFDHVSGLLTSRTENTPLPNNWDLKRQLPVLPTTSEKSNTLNSRLNLSLESIPSNLSKIPSASQLQLNKTELTKSLQSLSGSNLTLDKEELDPLNFRIPRINSGALRRSPVIKWKPNPFSSHPSLEQTSQNRIRSEFDGDNVSFAVKPSDWPKPRAKIVYF